MASVDRSDGARDAEESEETVLQQTSTSLSDAALQAQVLRSRLVDGDKSRPITPATMHPELRLRLQTLGLGFSEELWGGGVSSDSEVSTETSHIPCSAGGAGDDLLAELAKLDKRSAALVREGREEEKRRPPKARATSTSAQGTAAAARPYPEDPQLHFTPSPRPVGKHHPLHGMDFGGGVEETRGLAPTSLWRQKRGSSLQRSVPSLHAELAREGSMNFGGSISARGGKTMPSLASLGQKSESCVRLPPLAPGLAFPVASSFRSLPA